MEDSTGMTIEFLRARLLSERSVSRTARQRADELAKRVVELEEQLKIVSLQRKKAEKATENVLSILENHGINEFSEEFDSSSDREVPYLESKVSNGFPKEDESSVGLKSRRNHMDEFSGSELESSSLPGGSLSWKSGKDSPHSHEKKHVDSSTRSRSTFASTTSASLKCRVGKSCRRIQRRETRSAGEESQIDSSNRPCQDNGVDTCSEGSPTSSDIGPEILGEGSEKKDAKILLDGPVSGDFENQRSVSNTSKNIDIHGSEKDMERALEHQAQLIGQYEEEEKAQREWEEKFKEDSICAPDSCEPGNCSDVTAEQDETKGHTPPYPDATLSQDEDMNLNVENVCVAKESSEGQSDDFQLHPHVDTGCLVDQKSNGELACESPDTGFPVANGKQNPQHSCSEDLAENQSPQSVPNPQHSRPEDLAENQSPQSVPNPQHSHSEDLAENQSPQSVPSHPDSSFQTRDTFGSKNEYALIAHEMPDKLGSVLEALHQAKLSLKDKLTVSPLIDRRPSEKAIEYSVGGRPVVPVGCAGLFRVPVDFHLEATTKASIPGSNSRLSLPNRYADSGRVLTTGNHRFITSPYTESRSSASTVDNLYTIPPNNPMERRLNIPTWEPLETRPRFSSRQPVFGRSFDMGLPFSSRSTYDHPKRDTGLASSIGYASPTYPLYPDLIPRMPSDEGLPPFSSSDEGLPPFSNGPQPFSNGRAGVHPPNHLPHYDDSIRPNMYRL